MKLKKHQVVEFEWMDAHRKDGWIYNKEVKEWNDDDGYVKQVGYFIEETLDWYIIGSGMGHEKDLSYLCIHKVPKGMIRKIRKL